MTKGFKIVLAAMLATSMVTAQAQTADTKPVKKAVKKSAPAKKSIEEQIEELRLSTQKQIDDLKQQVADRDAQLKAASDAAAAQASAAAAKADAASSSSAQTATDVTTLKSTVDDVKTTNAGVVDTVITGQKAIQEELESPSTIHYKGITITPIAFVAAESVYRTRAIDSDINTPFNSTPYMNSSQAHTSEFNGSGRQSRLGALFTSKVPFGTFKGYFEADFLGTGITSNNNQSNSYVFRQRQIWGQIAMNSGFTFTAGQTWSLVTETKHGVDPTTENLPQTIDPQYHVGFDWARQYSLRLAQSFASNKAVVALSLEEPQIVNLTTTGAPFGVLVGSIGVNGGLYNLTNKYSASPAPDLIIKFAADPGYGHYEIGAVGRWFRDRIFPNLASTSTVNPVTGTVTPGNNGNVSGAYNSTVMGGGFFVNARMPATKKLDVGIHFMGGDGINRYGTSQLPDAMIKPTGVIEPLRGYQGLLSLETHPTKKLDVFGYAGDEYAQRTVYGGTAGYFNASNAGCYTEGGVVGTTPTTGTGTGTIFGSTPYNPTGSCGSVTKDIVEGTLGFTYRFYNSPTKGRFQFSAVYSYLTKEAWADTAGRTPIATNNMIFTGFRYYIP